MSGLAICKACAPCGLHSPVDRRLGLRRCAWRRNSGNHHQHPRDRRRVDRRPAILRLCDDPCHGGVSHAPLPGNAVRSDQPVLVTHHGVLHGADWELFQAIDDEALEILPGLQVYPQQQTAFDRLPRR
jgi:hypothetical protein